MNALIIVGSHRKNSQSKRIGDLFQTKFLLGLFSSIQLHDLSKLALPFWDENVAVAWKSELRPIQADICAADALVVITPEWSGMAAPMVKNYFLFSDHKMMAHKPALIVSVSAGLGGSYPIQELRGSSYKNTKVCYIPEHIIIRNVETAFTGHSQESDQRISKRVQFACKLLERYAAALAKVREHGLDWDDYPFGM